MEENETKKYDLSAIVANIEKVKEIKANNKKKPSRSLIPLKIEPNPNDSPLKSEIVRRINERNLIYSDLYNYCTKLKDGDCTEGQKLGYNIISGLKKRPSMMDTTFLMLCDFLELDVHLVSRNKDTNSEEEDDPYGFNS